MSLKTGVDLIFADIFSDYIVTLPTTTPSKVGTGKAENYSPKPVVKATVEANTPKKVGVIVTTYRGAIAYDLGGHIAI